MPLLPFITRLPLLAFLTILPLFGQSFREFHETQSPDIELHIPPFFIVGQKYRIKVFAFDSSGVTGHQLTLNETEFPSSKEASCYYTISIPMNETKREYTLITSAWDTWGNKSERRSTIRIKTKNQIEMPQLWLEKTTESSVTNKPDVTIEGFVYPPDSQVFLWDEPVITNNEGRFSFLFHLPSAKNRLTISAFHSNYDPMTITQTFLYDTSPPTILFPNYDEITFSKKPTVDIRIEVKDDNTGFDSCVLFRNNKRVYLRGNYLDPDVALQIGDNLIEYTAYDLAGNVAYKSINVYYEPRPASITISASDFLIPDTPLKVIVTATPSTAIKSISLSNDENEEVFTSDECSLEAFLHLKSSATIRASATLRDGSTISNYKSVQLAPLCLVFGQVLDDATSLPLKDIPVLIQSSCDKKSLVSQNNGSFKSIIYGKHFIISSDAPGFIPITREININPNEGFQAPDIRLTKRAPLQPFKNQTFYSQSYPTPFSMSWAGSLPQPVSITSFTVQGLPHLLPTGFTPLMGFELSGFPDQGSLTIDFNLNTPCDDKSLFLITSQKNQWLVLQNFPLHLGSNTINIYNPSNGNYALILPDPINKIGHELQLGSYLKGILPFEKMRPFDAHYYNKNLKVNENPNTSSFFEFIYSEPDFPSPSGTYLPIQVTEIPDFNKNLLPKLRYPLTVFFYKEPFGHDSISHTQSASLSIHSRTILNNGLKPPATFDFSFFPFFNPNLNTFGINYVSDCRIKPPESNSPLFCSAFNFDVKNLHNLEPLPGSHLLSSFYYAQEPQTINAPEISIFPYRDSSSDDSYILLREADPDHWVFVGQFFPTEDPKEWKNIPNQCDMQQNGTYAIVQIPGPVHTIQGLVTYQNKPIANTFIWNNRQIFPWYGISNENGRFHYFHSEYSYSYSFRAQNPYLQKESWSSLVPSQKSNSFFDLNFTLGDPPFTSSLIQPKNNQQFVSTLPNIIFEFSHPPQRNLKTISSSIMLRTGEKNVPLQLVEDENPYRLSFLPKIPLSFNTAYTLSMKDTFPSVFGSTLTNPYSFSFSTRHQTIERPLDFSYFYLDLQNGHRLLKAPSSAFPPQTILFISSKDTSSSPVTTTLLDSDLTLPLKMFPNYPITLYANVPDGTSFTHTLPLHMLGPNHFKFVHDSPVKIPLNENQTLYFPSVANMVRKEIFIEALPFSSLQNDLEALSQLAKRSSPVPISAFQINVSGKFPNLKGYLEIALPKGLPPSGLIHLASLLPNSAVPLDPTKPKILTEVTSAHWHMNLNPNLHVNKDPIKNPQNKVLLPFDFSGLRGLTDMPIRTVCFSTLDQPGKE